MCIRDSFNTDDVWFPETSAPIVASIADDYVVRYTSYVCFKRAVNLRLLLCSSDPVKVHINGKQVRCPHPVKRVQRSQACAYCCPAALCTASGRMPGGDTLGAVPLVDHAGHNSLAEK